MKRMLNHLVARPRMAMAAVVGLGAGVLVPIDGLIGHFLLGWNVGVWAYLALMAWMMLRADHGHLRRTALSLTQGAAVVLGLVVAASVASVVAIVAELSMAHHGDAPLALGHVLLAVSTVVGAWVLLPVVFTLSYASHYYRHAVPGGLKFPDADPKFQPNYVDFMYFSFTIAVAAQTADVMITSRPMRGLVLLQAVLSFAFNAAILAVAINIAAGLLPH